MKKIIVAALCIVILISFAGCAQTGESDMSSTYFGGEYGEAFSAFGPGVVMISADEFEITWGELFFHIGMIVESLRNHYMHLDLATIMSVYAEDVLNEAVQSALLFRVLEYGAREAGVTLSDETLAMLDADITDALERHDGDDALFDQWLWDHFSAYSRELYLYLAKTSMLSEPLIMHMYGPGGRNLPDGDVQTFTADDGYLMAMHILRNHDDLALGHAEYLIDRLNAYSGTDLVAYFAELMFAWSDDLGGVHQFPGGYLFQYGDMVPEFYYGTRNLEIGEVSGIIESYFGYHIIMRMPINFDTVPMRLLQMNLTLREATAMNLFETGLISRADSLDLIFTSEFESIDLAEIFSYATGAE
ncbi:MAG: peptidylprolyl isomerase [Oscillospiraceae bacterium]|nr:peptidylprolyl isomerase [Oscillospiraceae bacterium]